MERTIDPKLVELWVAAQGNKAITVTFIKKDGTQATRNGLPKVYKRRVGGERGAKQAQTLKDNGMLFFDHPNPEKRGFSFKLDRVTEMRAGGAIIKAR